MKNLITLFLMIAFAVATSAQTAIKNLSDDYQCVYPINPARDQPEQNESDRNASVGCGAFTESENGLGDQMICPENSLFSIVPQDYNNAYTSTPSSGYICYQSYSGVEGNIVQVTFWGIFSSHIIPASPEPFLIELRQPGSTPGVVVTATTVQLTGISTGQFLFDSYQIGVFTVDVPSTNLEAGWLSVQYQGPLQFFWLNTMAGEGYPAMQNTILPDRLAMCLGGGETGLDEATNKVFKIYPNPVNDILYIYSGDEMAEKIELINLQGAIVLRKPANKTQVQKIDLSGLSKGVYFLKIIIDKNIDKVFKIEKN
ncbi:MAG: T9SS type A sorting domain-containing protein [Bacteroidota bacterium]